jgi:hypothetical protein
MQKMHKGDAKIWVFKHSGLGYQLLRGKASKKRTSPTNLGHLNGDLFFEKMFFVFLGDVLVIKN